MGDIIGNLHFLICPTDIKMVRQTRRLTRRQTRRVAKVLAPAPAPVAKLSKPVARAVKAIVHRGAERKYVSERPLTVASGGLFPNDSLFNCVANSSSVEMFPCVPRTIQAGVTSTTSSSQRIGQKVKAARMYSDFYIALNPAATQSKDIIVKLWILTSKEFKNYDSIASMPVPINWLNDGQGGSTVSLGNLYDLTLPVENETWTQLKTYTFRLSKSSGLTQNNASYNASAAPVGKFIRYYHKGGPQQVCYDAQLSFQYPTNYSPVWCISYAYADGSTPQVNNKDIWVMNQNHMEFYDA